MKKLIISDKSILDGTPVIKGTRIPVLAVQQQIKNGNGDALSYINKVYPHLTGEQITAARKYGRT